MNSQAPPPLAGPSTAVISPKLLPRKRDHSPEPAARRAHGRTDGAANTVSAATNLPGMEAGERGGGRERADEFRHHVHEFSGHWRARPSALVLPSAPSVRNSLQLTRFSEHRARWQSELRLSLSVIGIFALSGEGVPALHSMTATGLSSRHRLEFGTRRLYRFSGLEAGALGI